MAVPFDHIAPGYESLFTYSAVGQLHRKRVWSYVEQVFPDLKGFEMLELNYGAGSDDALFGEQGVNLIATDIGQEMLKITEVKAEEISTKGTATAHYLDVESFNENLFDKKFDLIFSNFGGLNSINPQSFQKLLQRLPTILKPGGRFIGVVMPKFCAWETFYFMIRLRFRQAFRRIGPRRIAPHITGGPSGIWYYQPGQVIKWSREKFNLISVRPVGIALPPSYLEKFFEVKKRWLSKLNRLEHKLCERTMLSGVSDHYVIDLQLR